MNNIILGSALGNCLGYKETEKKTVLFISQSAKRTWMQVRDRIKGDREFEIVLLDRSFLGVK